MRLITALKHTASNSSHLPTINHSSGLQMRNVEEALRWFGSLASWVLETENLPSPIVLIPIPDSQCTAAEPCQSKTFQLARAISSKIKQPAVVCDALRWKRGLTAAHIGGPRCYGDLHRSLLVIRDPMPGSVVLVDDVFTSGAHVFACAAVLKHVGVHCANAVCVARTECQRFIRQFDIRRATLLRPITTLVNSLFILFFLNLTLFDDCIEDFLSGLS